MPTSSERAHRIGWAVKQAKAGRAVTRRGWKVAGQAVSYCVGDQGGSRPQPYLRLTTASGRSWPFTFGQRDILAEDWMLAG